MKVDLSFQSSYGIRYLEELGTGQKFYYPGASTEGGSDGLIVEVISPYRKGWMGIFAFGKISPKAISGIYSMPDPDKFCVVSKGAGYIISSTDPKTWQEVKSIPIMDVRPIVSKKILVFADYTDLVAYDETGIRWRSERLAYDNFKIIDVTTRSLKCEFWNIQNEANEVFEVDLANGSKKMRN